MLINSAWHRLPLHPTPPHKIPYIKPTVTTFAPLPRYPLTYLHLHLQQCNKVIDQSYQGTVTTIRSFTPLRRSLSVTKISLLLLQPFHPLYQRPQCTELIPIIPHIKACLLPSSSISMTSTHPTPTSSIDTQAPPTDDHSRSCLRLSVQHHH